VKRLYSRGEKQFKAEVEMLKAFSRSRCPHLVKLLATFRHKGHYYLLFPWAKSNLRKYWEYTPRPDFSEATVLWSLEQCKALASGLLRIHEHETTHDSFNQRAEIQPALSEHNSPGTEKGDRLYGRHGDIKPENILWTSDDQNHLNTMGILLIADFGLMEFHTQLTRSLVLPGNLRGSQTYEPPERRLRTQISRAYDIWSLGCVYLEFITWLVCGMQGLERFPLARGITMDKVNDDTFYTIIDDGLDPSPRGIVRESVQEWIKDLHEQPRCSDFIHDFLNLVSEHMLVVNPGKRIRCGLLVDRFCSMVRDASKASNYLTTGTPSEPRAHQADLTTPRTPSVSAVDGASLPQYPGTAYSHEEMLCVSPQIEPEVLESLSPSSSPNLSMKEFGMK
jgi:serine/threonine protein kinase